MLVVEDRITSNSLRTDAETEAEKGPYTAVAPVSTCAAKKVRSARDIEELDSKPSFFSNVSS